jgi:hypothetical protein
VSRRLEKSPSLFGPKVYPARSSPHALSRFRLIATPCQTSIFGSRNRSDRLTPEIP